MNRNEHLGQHLKSLNDVHDYRVEKGDPDPRGYTLETSDGRTIGRVDDLVIDTEVMKVRYLVVERDDSLGDDADESHILVPVDDVDVRTDARRVIANRFTGSEQTWSHQHTDTDTSARTARATEDNRITRSEEELEIGKREVSRGEARIGKHVETEHVSEPVTRRREEVVIERRPVETGARADASLHDDEIRVPLMEEELVVDKRAVVKEELVVGKRIVEERDTVEADLRREEFDVDERTQTERGRTPRRTE